MAPWEDLFQTLRRSCETEWALKFQQHSVSAWIGRSVATSLKHYVQVPEHLLDLAATPSAAKSAAAKRGTEEQGAENDPSRAADGRSPQCDESTAMAAISAESAAPKEMRLMGLEPMTYGLKVRCSTN